MLALLFLLLLLLAGRHLGRGRLAKLVQQLDVLPQPTTLGVRRLQLAANMLLVLLCRRQHGRFWLM